MHTPPSYIINYITCAAVPAYPLPTIREEKPAELRDPEEPLPPRITKLEAPRFYALYCSLLTDIWISLPFSLHFLIDTHMPVLHCILQARNWWFFRRLIVGVLWRTAIYAERITDTNVLRRAKSKQKRQLEKSLYELSTKMGVKTVASYEALKQQSMFYFSLDSVFSFFTCVYKQNKTLTWLLPNLRVLVTCRE